MFFCLMVSERDVLSVWVERHDFVRSIYLVLKNLVFFRNAEVNLLRLFLKKTLQKFEVN